MLITSTPDLTPLRHWVLERLKVLPRRWQDLQTELRPELWREPQLNEIVRTLRKEKLIEATDYAGSFSAKANPFLRLAQN